MIQTITYALYVEEGGNMKYNAGKDINSRLRIKVLLSIILLAICAIADTRAQDVKRLQMKCIWAYQTINDSTSVMKRDIGKIIKVSFNVQSSNGSINYITGIIDGKAFRSYDFYLFDSSFMEKDYWLLYTTCRFSSDYKNMIWKTFNKQIKGTTRIIYRYYVQDIEQEPFSSMDEFKKHTCF